MPPLLAAVAPVRLNVRRGAGHGGCCGGDARVPGGAETAAERAADPGVRPALGVRAARRSACLFLLLGEPPPPSEGRSFEFLSRC